MRCLSLLIERNSMAGIARNASSRIMMSISRVLFEQLAQTIRPDLVALCA
jgi:hypothetical protein